MWEAAARRRTAGQTLGVLRAGLFGGEREERHGAYMYHPKCNENRQTTAGRFHISNCPFPRPTLWRTRTRACPSVPRRLMSRPCVLVRREAQNVHNRSLSLCYHPISPNPRITTCAPFLPDLSFSIPFSAATKHIQLHPPPRRYVCSTVPAASLALLCSYCVLHLSSS